MSAAPSLTGSVRVTLPLRVVNESNQRGKSPYPKAGRTKHAREHARFVVGLHVRSCGLVEPSPPSEKCERFPFLGVPCECTSENGYLEVTLVRVMPDRRSRLDDDGITSAMKAARDGLAKSLSLDDRDHRLVWRYGQRLARPREIGLVNGYAVEVRIEPRHG